ncbi:hypothetical protein B7494_g7322 [Chlorociboria aeruginascens]|nr:hypothetical protein B7494_g7322 [Chlorociboria aeruginascens]
MATFDAAVTRSESVNAIRYDMKKGKAKRQHHVEPPRGLEYDTLTRAYSNILPPPPRDECYALDIMAEDLPSTGFRPQIARKDSRKVPGGFEIDDVDDLSPDKDHFDHQMIDFAQMNALAHNHNRMASLDVSKLPSLPPATDSSLLYSHGDSEGNLDSVDEKEMQRHLNDVESSFLPTVSPIGMSNKAGVDDTYLFDGAAQGSPLRGLKSIDTNATAEAHSIDNSPSPPGPADAYESPAPEHESLEAADQTGNATSSLEAMSSSPTAAAAARTVSRAISVTSIGGYETAHDELDSKEHTDTDEDFDIEATPKKSVPSLMLYSGSDEGTTLHHRRSNRSLNGIEAGSTPGVALLKRHSSGGIRPKYLRSRFASQRSSTSSFVTNPEHDDSSDVTLGTDYALQSGGAVPTLGYSRSSSIGLSRSISLGSMASGVEYLPVITESGRADGRSLALDEEEFNREHKSEHELSPPETPRATGRSMAAPTDTIIARHVRNVQVPESLAKEYRTKKWCFISKKDIWVRSTIERLSKENFDLKLKVMFLSDRLDKLSEEGVKEMISENVELKTGLAVMQRDNRALKRKIKELEKQLEDDEGRPGTARSGASTVDSPKWFDQEGAQEREEELVYLRERVEEYVTEIDKLRNDSISRENEKRHLAEVVRSMGERRGQNLEAREEMDVWKDLLEQETSRREQSDEENKKLREEISRLKTETTSNSGIPGLSHTTNIYNITKKRQVSPSRPRSGLSDRTEDRNGAFSAASTVVEDLRRETEQLKHENAELRREVGAQTSMLTSRNREKERLYQEIEDLKLGHRRGGGSTAGDSIFERSASRANERPASRASGGTRQTNITEEEREEFENKNAELRDKINSLKIQNQDLQRQLESSMDDFEIAAQQKKDAEILAQELQETLDMTENDLLTMQTDRDEALQGQEEIEIAFESLQREAQEELDDLAAQAEESNTEIERLQSELADMTENFNALQNEMRDMSEGIVRLEDDHENTLRRTQELEKELDDANRELEEMEKNLVESNGKIDRLTVQQESSQSEIAFLREEQDGDKIKIGDLEAAVKSLEQSLQGEKGHVRELEQRLANERHQREVLAGREKQDVQKVVNQLNRDLSTSKDQVHELSKKLHEAEKYRQKLSDLEGNLHEVLGGLDGTKQSFVHGILKLKQDMEVSERHLEHKNSLIAEKDQQIKEKDVLLESQVLESRQLADIIDKERQAHRSTKQQFESFRKSEQRTTNKLSQQESRLLELESSRQQERRKLSTLENTSKDQLTERNNLLLVLWNRLSKLCGTDWANNNRLINGRALPTLEVISTMLPGFSKNLLAAVKTLETIVGDFQVRVRKIEHDLWREYQNLENGLDIRAKRLDRLEALARSAVPGKEDRRGELMRLKDINRTLKTEISTLRSALDVKSNVYGSDTSPAPSVPTGPRNKMIEKTRTSTLTRHHSASEVETYEQAKTSRNGSEDKKSEDSDPNMKLRLKELEYIVQSEREARKLDRNAARQRLNEKARENEELAAELERYKIRDEGKMLGSPGKD